MTDFLNVEDVRAARARAESTTGKWSIAAKQDYHHGNAWRVLEAIADLPEPNQADECTASYALMRDCNSTLTLHRICLCRVPACINPEHLEQVTIGENVLRGNAVSGVNRRKVACPQGHQYDAENTYTDKRGKRHCRACCRDRIARCALEMRDYEVDLEA